MIRTSTQKTEKDIHVRDIKTLQGLKLCDVCVVSLCVQGNGQCVTRGLEEAVRPIETELRGVGQGSYDSQV
jgi:hypothetical protein